MHTLSQSQLVARENRRIHRGIGLARDAIYRAGENNTPCGIQDLDFMAGFDQLTMDWVYLVLKKIGLGQKIIDRLKRIYKVGLTVVVVNNILGRCFPNIYHLLRQGDKPSMIFFGIGIDPLLRYLERRLCGIDIWSIPRHGPTIQSCISSTLPPMKQKYRLISYADDVKPSISSISEFYTVSEGSQGWN